MIVDPGDWPYRTRTRTVITHAEMQEITQWLKEHIGQRGTDWDMSFGEWLFERRDDLARFILTWG